jgi:alpha-D-xyloside xylohydrolase
VVWGFADGSDERTKHKDYSRLYHRVYGETLGEDGGFLLCRAGTWGGQVNASIIWPGDLDADLSQHRDLREDGTLAVGGLPAAVSAAIGLGPSGYPFFGSDTGGYRHSPPDRETFIRWFQHSALSAVMQVGNSASVQPWELLDESDLSLYRDFSRLHLRLFPYLWSLAKNIESGGRPILLPFGLAQPEHGAHPADQYFVGPELMVAPVIEMGARTRTFTCPTGTYLNWFDGSPLDCTSGSPITVDAPLESLPLYLRAGGIVPMLRPDIDTLSPVEDPSTIASFASEPESLWARIALGASGSSQLYDGSELELEDDGSTATVTFRPGDVFVSGMGLEVVGLGGSPTGVQVDGSDSADWTWEAGILRVSAASSTVRIQR